LRLRRRGQGRAPGCRRSSERRRQRALRRVLPQRAPR